MDHEDLYSLLYTFYELCGPVGMTWNGMEALLLRLFPFSLNGKAKA